MALKELLKQRVMERLNFSQEISDDYLKEVIQQEIVKVSKDYPMLLSDKIRLKQEVFYALRKLDILQDLLEDDTITEIMITASVSGTFFRCREAVSGDPAGGIRSKSYGK